MPPSQPAASHLEPSPTTTGDPAFWPSILALGVGGFAIGTGEFVIMGLLPEAAVT